MDGPRDAVLERLRQNKAVADARTAAKPAASPQERSENISRQEA
jgi:hypothetical protein